MTMEIESGSEHDPELAQLVGQVVLAATTLDYFTCHLVAVALGDTDDAWTKYWGQSGERLIHGLELAGARGSRLLALVAPMTSVVQRRNQVVHGMWFLDSDRGPGAYEIARPVRKVAGESDDRGFSLDDLRQLQAHIRTLDLYVYALRQYLEPAHRYGTGEALEPMPLILPSLAGIADFEYPDVATERSLAGRRPVRASATPAAFTTMSGIENVVTAQWHAPPPPTARSPAGTTRDGRVSVTTRARGTIA